MGVVYARYDTRVVWSGGMSVLCLGDVWDAASPLVAERPELFSATPTRVRGQARQAAPAEVPEPPLEQGSDEAAAAEGPRARSRRRGGS